MSDQVTPSQLSRFGPGIRQVARVGDCWVVEYYDGSVRVFDDPPEHSPEMSRTLEVFGQIGEHTGGQRIDRGGSAPVRPFDQAPRRVPITNVTTSPISPKAARNRDKRR